MNNTTRITSCFAAGLVLAASGAAMADVHVGVNIGVPGPAYVVPAPVYVAPAPVYAPPPPAVVYAPAPAIIIGWHGDRYWDGRRYWARDDWYRHHGGPGHDHDHEHGGWHGHGNGHWK